MADGLFDDLIPAKKQGLFDDLIPGTRTPVGASPAPLASAGSGKAPPQLGVWNPDTGRFDTDRIPRAKPQQGYFGRVGSAVA